MRFKIILNPTSGRGAGNRSISKIRSAFKSNALVFEIAKTERPWHAAELARQAVRDGFGVVVAAGGDGTLNETLNGLMQAKIAGEGTATLGVIPIGTGNDFAYSMGIPINLEASCNLIALQKRQSIDVGLVSGGLYPQGRYFGNGVGIGFDAVVGFEAQKLRRLSGFPAYLIAALKTMYLYFTAPQVKIEHDNGSFELAALMVSMMNGRRMGGGFMMAPDGVPDDGVMDICIANQVSKMEIFRLIGRFMKGNQNSHPAIETLRTSRIKVTALSGILPAHSDGETLCTEGTELTLELLPKQIELICEPKK